MFGQDIVPGTTYEVHAECGAYTTAAGIATTSIWGDVCGPDFDAPPNGAVNLTDIVYVLDTFTLDQGIVADNGRYAADLAPCVPNGVVNLDDVIAVLDAFTSQPYPCPEPCQP